MKIINHFKSFMEELKNPYMFIVFLTTSIVFTYFGLKVISRLPETETIPEMIKFYFKDAFSYVGDMFILFISGLFVMTLGIFFFYIASKLNKEVFRTILLALVGSAIFVFGFYLTLNSLVLFIALAIIAGAVWLFAQTSSSNRK